MLDVAKHLSVSRWVPGSTCNILSPRDRYFSESFCSSTETTFLYRFFHSPNDIEACFIKYNASGVPHFGLFVEIIINALRASLISVLLLLTLIRLISLLQIYFKNHSVALISGFNLFRDRFSLSLLNKVPRVPKCSSA